MTEPPKKKAAKVLPPHLREQSAPEPEASTDDSFEPLSQESATTTDGEASYFGSVVLTVSQMESLQSFAADSWRGNNIGQFPEYDTGYPPPEGFVPPCRTDQSPLGADSAETCGGCVIARACLGNAVLATLRGGDWGDNFYGGLNPEQLKEAASEVDAAKPVFASGVMS